MFLALWLPGMVPGDAAPVLNGLTLDGGRVNLAALHGQVVVVDFWASWCEPCRHSFPALDALARRYSARGLVVVGVSVDDELANCQRFVHELHPGFAILHDASHAITERWSPDAMPTTFVIDRSGRVAAVVQGVPADEHTLERAVVTALGGP